MSFNSRFVAQKNNSFFRRFFASRLFLLLSVLALVVVVVSFARAYYQDYTVQRDILRLQDEVRSLEKKKLESMQILEYVTSDAFIEEKARTELNLKKPGENIVYIENQASVALGEEVSDLARQNISNPVKWWYYFTHREISRE